MRLLKILSVISFITFMALVYVYQQTQIFYLAYQSDKKQAQLQDALETNNILRYNIGVFSSLPYLDKNLLAKYSDFEIPNEQRLVRLNIKQGKTSSSRVLEKRSNLFSKFFNVIIKQAEARTLNR